MQPLRGGQLHFANSYLNFLAPELSFNYGKTQKIKEPPAAINPEVTEALEETHSEFTGKPASSRSTGEYAHFLKLFQMRQVDPWAPLLTGYFELRKQPDCSWFKMRRTAMWFAALISKLYPQIGSRFVQISNYQTRKPQTLITGNSSLLS